jgi:predicted ferric reductase
VAFVTFGYADAAATGVAAQTWSFVRSYPWLLAAYAATLLLTLIGLTSIRAIKARMRYETWYHTHLYAYLAAALAFAHQITVSADLTGAARWGWIALYATVLALAVWGRIVQPLRLTFRHRFRVSHVVPEAPGVSSIHLAGRRMRELAVKPGQFLRFRFLTRDGWWQAHPFSLSAAPHERGLRITVKALGDHTRDLQTLPVGTRVVVDGPYGGFTADAATSDRTLLVAAGIGITPVRALLEDLPAGPERTVLIYRARDRDDLVFREELEELAGARGAHLVYLLGDDRVRLDRQQVLRLVPDVAERDAFVCGPPGLVSHLQQTLRGLGVRRIHLDPFEL